MLASHRGVVVRSVHPEEFFSLLDILNGLFERLLRGWPRQPERKALLASLGFEQEYGGANPTMRPEGAAEHLS